jgi:hypothetical protein
VVVVTVDPTGPPGNDGAGGLLDGTDTTKGPQVTVRDPGELLLDLLHVVSSDSLRRIILSTKENEEGVEMICQC